MIKTGVIGCGMIAEKGHLPAIQQVPGLKLYALYDQSFERAKYLQKRFHVPHAYPDEEAFFASDIDAVIVCTPAPVHYKNILDAAKWHWNEDGERVDSPLRAGRMQEGGPMVDCGVHQIDLARWWLESEVAWQRGIGVWIDDYEAPDHMYLHMAHDCGAHSMIEMSFSYNTTSMEPRTNFLYELIGTDGVIRYSREEHSLELRNSHGTQYLPWNPEKSFYGIHAEFAKALESGQPGDMPTAHDGLMATRIATRATRQAINDRDNPSKECPSTRIQAKDVETEPLSVPLDTVDLPVISPEEAGTSDR